MVATIKTPARKLAGPALALVILACCATPGAAAGPKYWDWPASRSFDEVTLTAAGLDTLGGVTAGPSARLTALDGPEVAWRLVSDGRDGWFLGTGHGGEIHHVAADGTKRLVARLESTEVFSLAVLPGGELLAGCGPDGRLVRVTAAGDATEVGRIEGGYVWAVAVDAKGSVAWLATGAPAAVYRYSWRDGKLERVAALPAQNTMDVALDSDGSLLAVTQGPGLVYRVPTGGKGEPRLLGDIAQDEARRLLRGPGGAFHVLGLASVDADGEGSGVTSGGAEGHAASAAPAAALYRLGPGGAPVRVWAGDRALMTAAWSPRWGWLGAGTLGDGGDGAAAAGPSAIISAAAAPATAEEGPASPREDARTVVYRLAGGWGSRPLASWPGGDVLDIVPFADGGFALAQAHPAALAVAGQRTDAASAVSPPLDGGVGVAWGRLRWEGVDGEGAPRWSVRGGQRAEPDASWSGWSAPWSEPDHALAMADCRYLQWRVELPPARAGARAWRVTGVSVSARQPNLPPVIEEFKLEQLRGLKTAEAGNDNIVHEYRSGLSAEFTLHDAPDQGWTGADRIDAGRAVRVATWRASDPNGDRLESRLECRREGEAAWRPVTVKGTGSPGEPLTGTLGSWDASQMEDGRYALRLVVSDAPDNPGAAAATAVRELGPLAVDNTPPALRDVSAVAAPGGVRVRLRASDGTSPVAGARVFLPDGGVERLDPVDGICDSADESFDVVVPWPRPGRSEGPRPWRVRVEVRDLAGNPAGSEVVVQ